MSNKPQPLSIFLFVVDSLIIPLSLFLATELRTQLPYGRGGALRPGQVEIPWPVYLFSVLAWIIALLSSDVYDPQRVLRWFHEALRVTWSSVIATFLLAGLLYFTYREISRLQVLYFSVLALFFLLAYRGLLRVSYRILGFKRIGGKIRVFIIGAGEVGQRVGKMVEDHSRWGLTLVGYLDDDPDKSGSRIRNVEVLGSTSSVKGLVKQHRVDEVWIALPVRAYDRIDQIVQELEDLPVRIKVIPDYFSMALIRADAEIFDGIPVIGLREPVIVGPERVVKRVFDVVVSFLLLVLLAPVFFLISLAIKFGSKGPVLFAQKRYGENGRIFEMYKFRTMVPDAFARDEEVRVVTDDGEFIHKRIDDPRVTAVGKVLRRFSLDELPQLINVLKGDMSLVGPRPELPWLVERYDPWQRKRFAVPQGITGWWQINGRSDKPMHLHTEDDLYYVYNYSLWLDIQILLRTPWVVLRGTGAF